MTKSNKKARPLLVGEKVNKSGIAVWCPFCARYHRHCWDEDDKETHVSHRVAHCDDGSPFLNGGYYIGISKPFKP
jgi:hypothetical protein